MSDVTKRCTFRPEEGVILDTGSLSALAASEHQSLRAALELRGVPRGGLVLEGLEVSLEESKGTLTLALTPGVGIVGDSGGLLCRVEVPFIERISVDPRGPTLLVLTLRDDRVREDGLMTAAVRHHLKLECVDWARLNLGRMLPLACLMGSFRTEKLQQDLCRLTSPGSPTNELLISALRRIEEEIKGKERNLSGVAQEARVRGFLRVEDQLALSAVDHALAAVEGTMLTSLDRVRLVLRLVRRFTALYGKGVALEQMLRLLEARGFWLRPDSPESLEALPSLRYFLEVVGEHERAHLALDWPTLKLGT